MKSIYTIEVYSLPPAEECNYWADVWNTYSLTLNGDYYKKKKERYKVEFQPETWTWEQTKSVLEIVQEKGIIEKVVPVLRKVKL